MIDCLIVFAARLDESVKTSCPIADRRGGVVVDDDDAELVAVAVVVVVVVALVPFVRCVVDGKIKS